MSADTGRVSISRVSSDKEEKKQVLQETVIVCVLLAANDTSFSSFKTIWSITATSCCILDSNGTRLILGSLGFKSHKMLDGSTFWKTSF